MSSSSGQFLNTICLGSLVEMPDFVLGEKSISEPATFCCVQRLVETYQKITEGLPWWRSG